MLQAALLLVLLQLMHSSTGAEQPSATEQEGAVVAARSQPPLAWHLDVCSP